MHADRMRSLSRFYFIYADLCAVNQNDLTSDPELEFFSHVCLHTGE